MTTIGKNLYSGYSGPGESFTTTLQQLCQIGYCYDLPLFFLPWRDQTQGLCMAGKCSTNELHPQLHHVLFKDEKIKAQRDFWCGTMAG
jgi:hypothetical protein